MKCRRTAGSGPPSAGREFSRQEDVPDGVTVAILSHAFWQRAFHGDAAVLGVVIQPAIPPNIIEGEHRRGAVRGADSRAIAGADVVLERDVGAVVAPDAFIVVVRHGVVDHLRAGGGGPGEVKPRAMIADDEVVGDERRRGERENAEVEVGIGRVAVAFDEIVANERAAPAAA